MKHLLAVYSTQTGRTRALLGAACDGAAELATEVELRLVGSPGTELEFAL